jgi:hypothetical protein
MELRSPLAPPVTVILARLMLATGATRSSSVSMRKWFACLDRASDYPSFPGLVK